MELLPPSPGSCVMRPPCHAKATQELPLSKPNAGHEKFSFRGSCTPFSVTPEIKPKLFLTGHAISLLGPPSVPRGTCKPLCHSVASRTPLELIEKPVTQPMLLMALPALTGPPSVPRSTTR